MIKKNVLFLFLLIVVMVLAGCREENVYDVEKFNHINEYVIEILPAIEETAFDFDLWVIDPANEEKKEWLQMDAERIEDVNIRYINANFPTYEEIETWTVPVSDGEKRWTIKGTKLAPVLHDLEESTRELVDLIYETTGTVEANEQFFAGKAQEIKAALDKTREAAKIVSELFRLQVANNN